MIKAFCQYFSYEQIKCFSKDYFIKYLILLQFYYLEWTFETFDGHLKSKLKKIKELIVDSYVEYDSLLNTQKKQQ